jgi:hypothetical protein
MRDERPARHVTNFRVLPPTSGVNRECGTESVIGVGSGQLLGGGRIMQQKSVSIPNI